MISAFYWGTNYENILNFSYPLYDLITDHPPRDGSDFVQGVSGLEDAWITGYDYTLEGEMRYLQLGAQSIFAAGPGGQGEPLGGSASLQGFLDWCRAKNTVRFVPDYLGAPGFYVDGCYLADPVKGGGGRGLTNRLDWTQKFKFRQPTMDFALALRGLMFEYSTGGDELLPAAATFARSTVAEYLTAIGSSALGFVNPTGAASVAQAAINALRDRHYPLASALRATLVERGQTNSCLQSQTLATAPWAQVGSQTLAVTNGQPGAPDGTSVACVCVPNAVSGTHAVGQAITITSGEFVAVSIYVRAGNYPAITLRFGDTGSTNGFQVDFDASTGLFGSVHGGFGAGVLTGFRAIALAGGWYRVEMWGQVNAAVTAAQVFCYVFNTIANANAGSNYAGDGVSGLSLTRAQVERNGTTNSFPPSSYMATTNATVTRGADALSYVFSFPPQPMFGYVKYVEGGDRYGSQGNCFTFQIGSSSATGRVLLDAGAGSVAAFFQPPSGSVSSSVVATPNVGDTVEDMFVLAPSGAGLTVQARRSINGAAESAGAVSGLVVPAAAWGDLNIYLGANATQGGTSFARGLITARAGPLTFAGQSITTIAQARAL